MIFILKITTSIKYIKYYKKYNIVLRKISVIITQKRNRIFINYNNYKRKIKKFIDKTNNIFYYLFIRK